MSVCSCRSRSGLQGNVLRLQCCACVNVCCRTCGGERWWPETERLAALNAAEVHRWESGHAEVLVRDARGIILREVLGDLAAA